MTSSELKKSTQARAAAVAELLHSECTILQELYREKETFTADLAAHQLVSVVPPSSQLEAKDKLWCLHSALRQCHALMERAISKEEEELGDGTTGAYETQRKLVKDRLGLLLVNTEELLRAAECGTVVTPTVDVLETKSPTTLFELKVWVYQVFKEVAYWSRTTSTILRDMPVVIAREEARTTRAPMFTRAPRFTRATRSIRRTQR